MKQDSRSPEQNRSLYTPPPPPPQDIESRVYIHKATSRKKFNLKTDSIHRYHSFKSLIFYYAYWRILPFIYGGGAGGGGDRRH